MRGHLVAGLDAAIPGFTETTESAAIARTIVEAIERAAEASGVEAGIVGRLESSGTSISSMLTDRLAGEERSDLTGDDIVAFLESALEIRWVGAGAAS